MSATPRRCSTDDEMTQRPETPQRSRFRGWPRDVDATATSHRTHPRASPVTCGVLRSPQGTASQTRHDSAGACPGPRRGSKRRAFLRRRRRQWGVCQWGRLGCMTGPGGGTRMHTHAHVQHRPLHTGRAPQTPNEAKTKEQNSGRGPANVPDVVRKAVFVFSGRSCDVQRVYDPRSTDPVGVSSTPVERGSGEGPHAARVSCVPQAPPEVLLRFGVPLSTATRSTPTPKARDLGRGHRDGRATDPQRPSPRTPPPPARALPLWRLWSEWGAVYTTAPTQRQCKAAAVTVQRVAPPEPDRPLVDEVCQGQWETRGRPFADGESAGHRRRSVVRTGAVTDGEGAVCGRRPLSEWRCGRGGP